MRYYLTLVVLLVVSGCSSEHQHNTTASVSPYAGEEHQAIKTLSPEQVQSYLAGEGLGYAKVAELNSYPGPRHVLDLADQLQLSDEQEAKTRAEFEMMQQKARQLGKEYVQLETELESMFADNSVTEVDLAKQLEKIAKTEGDIRMTHLESHLRMKLLLTEEQVTRYDMLRGYSGGDGGDDHDQHSDHSSHG